MRRTLTSLLTILWISLFVACGDDATRPPSTRTDATVRGEISDADFEFEIRGGEPGDPMAGPFRLRGTDLHYDDVAGALVVDLTVLNHGSYPHREPIGLTFIQLDPDEVTVLNADNDNHGDGAAIIFQFANDDGVWTPGETSLPRTVQFGVAKGQSIAFVARLDLGAPIDGGTIAGRVWHDANENGVMEDTETGIQGVALYLYPFSDDEDSTLTREIGYADTDADGHYAFHHLRAGGYVVSTATVTNECRPTTPTEIHVLLVEVDGEVSSYRGANFGCIPLWTPPPIVGQLVHVKGKFFEPENFYASDIEYFVCPDDSVPGPLSLAGVDPRCYGARLHGSVTEIAPTRNAFRVMATWVMAGSFPDEMKVGDRVAVHVVQGPGPGGWMLDSLILPWGEPHDELQGRVEGVDAGPDGQLRLRVLNTWVSFANATVGRR